MPNVSGMKEIESSNLLQINNTQSSNKDSSRVVVNDTHSYIERKTKDKGVSSKRLNALKLMLSVLEEKVEKN